MIFLTFILVSMVGVTIIFSINAKERAEKSYCRTLTDLACRSVLSEYDIRLKDDYGIFAFRGSDEYVSEKVSFYLDYMEKNSKTVFTLETDCLCADVKGFEINNVDIFEKQITEAAKYDFLNPDKYSEGGNELREIISSTETEARVKEEYDAESLPSYGYSNSGLNVKIDGLTAEGLPGLVSSAGNTFLVNSYILSVFGSFAKSAGKETYFNYEIEYIISGKENDIDNLNMVKQYFITLRTPINIAKIYADPSRAAAALAQAEAMTPGPAATATQLVIITAWAIEDAEKEWIELLRGGCVDGLNYTDYLAIFLTLQDRELKLLRMMDLIQLNLRYTYYDSFILNEHVCGFRLEVGEGERKVLYEHKY